MVIGDLFQSLDQGWDANHNNSRVTFHQAVDRALRAGGLRVRDLIEESRGRRIGGGARLEVCCCLLGGSMPYFSSKIWHQNTGLVVDTPLCR